MRGTAQRSAAHSRVRAALQARMAVALMCGTGFSSLVADPGLALNVLFTFGARSTTWELCGSRLPGGWRLDLLGHRFGDDMSLMDDCMRECNE
jgi:hypothetical protein